MGNVECPKLMNNESNPAVETLLAKRLVGTPNAFGDYWNGTISICFPSDMSDPMRRWKSTVWAQNKEY